MSLTFSLELPDCPATLEERILLEAACQKSFKMRQLVRQRAAEDVEWFIDFLLFTYDPRKEAYPHHLPFLLYDYQRDYLRWIIERYENQEDGLTEKSRDMGATWINLAFFLHHFLFVPGFTALLGSRKEDLVSNGTTNSLFGRIEYMMRRLPSWLLPRDFRFEKHFHRLRIENPELGNFIEGESANAQFSRQGRYSVIFIDEGAFWEDLDRSWRAAGDSTDCRLIVSTPSLDDWKFKELRDSGMSVYTMHWRLHPKKDDAWLARQRERKSEIDIQQELEINYNPVSSEGRVYPQWEEIERGAFRFEPDKPLYASVDFGLHDDTAILWAQRDPVNGEIRIIDCYSNRGKPIDFYVPFFTGEIPEYALVWEDPEDPTAPPVKVPWPYTYTEDERKQIALHAEWGIPTIFGDPAGKARSQASGDSPIQVLRRYGVHVKTNDAARDWNSRYTMTQLLIRWMKLNWPTCAALDEAIRNARFPENHEKHKNRTAGLVKPVHDWTSHYRTALEYLCVNLPPVVERKRFAPVRRRLAYQLL